ncbi:hypothetical protein CsNV_009 [Callinectes sapidus nudivirus]|nr:hypothetical protein CsNV_009 [Callinectes sapidus nudivirus]
MEPPRKRIAFEGVSCIGKSTFLHQLKKEGKHVEFIDLSDFYKELENFGDKNLASIIFMLMQVATSGYYGSCLSSTLYVDRSPLSSLYYYQIGKIMKEANGENLEQVCRKELNKFFMLKTNKNEPSLIKYNIIKLLEIYPTIMFTTKSIEETALNLLNRATELDLKIANINNFNFDYDFCLWYTRVQNEYFRKLATEYISDITHCELKNCDDFMIAGKEAIRETKFKIEKNYELLYMCTFNSKSKKTKHVK